MKLKVKEFTKEFTLTNPQAAGRKLTLVAEVGPKVVHGVDPKTKLIVFEDGGTRLSVGYAVKDPADTTSPADLGLTIARGRRDKSPILSLTLKNPRISQKLVEDILALVAREMDERFYSFVPLGNGNKKKKPEEGKEVIHTEESSGKA
jgi:hypothetical protein